MAEVYPHPVESISQRGVTHTLIVPVGNGLAVSRERA